ncbi:DEAD-box ATP-dependent RNA helicase 50 [Citrus sinensis]|uniref:DEAD-box ATP-dependent RNA helicase 50 n=1 Tax=Citrus sinensis TaxID=2711 RepID=A0ACB8MA59_CITSI|nr:DEAD-box ATP-dependent RNA helicase 50 [Citrus sinensis]
MLGRVEQVMLAKAAASFGLPLASPPLRRNSNNDKLMNKCVLPLLNPNPVGRPGARVILVRASGGDGGGGGYSRTPLETAGAYELIDNDTGEKVIVWGGTDDDHDHDHDHDPPIPPKHLLDSSNWNKDPSQPTASSPVLRNNDSSIPSKKGVISSFSRLKAQRVKAVVDKRSAMGKKTVNALKQEGRLSKTTPSLENFRELGEHIVDNDVPAESIDKNISDYNSRSNKHEKSGTKIDRGWRSGGSIHNLQYEPTDRPKQRHKYSANGDFFSRKSFKELGCSDYMIESLKRQNFLRPSQIQAMAFPPVVEGKSCILADQSGSGKTLAYLLPVIQRLRQEELQGLSKSTSGSPRVVILAPTAELASQVLSNCRSLSKCGVPFRSMVVTGGFRQKTQLENLQEGVDVLIATPGRFMFLIKEGILQLINLRCAILDEVDILFNDEDFEVALQSLISSSPVTAQYLFVTATLPVEIYNKLVEVFPDCKVVMGPGMHRISPGLEEFLVDCSGDQESDKTPETAFLNKKSALLQLIEKSPVSKTIVFCNKVYFSYKCNNLFGFFSEIRNVQF